MESVYLKLIMLPHVWHENILNMYPVVDASYLMSSSPPQFRCLNCSASQVCPQDGPLYQVRGTHDCTYDPNDACPPQRWPLPPQTQGPKTRHLAKLRLFELQSFIFSTYVPKVSTYFSSLELYNFTKLKIVINVKAIIYASFSFNNYQLQPARNLCSILNLCSVLNTYLCVVFFFFIVYSPTSERKKCQIRKG